MEVSTCILVASCFWAGSHRSVQGVVAVASSGAKHPPLPCPGGGGATASDPLMGPIPTLTPRAEGGRAHVRLVPGWLRGWLDDANTWKEVPVASEDSTVDYGTGGARMDQFTAHLCRAEACGLSPDALPCMVS